jgi:hypothetical protein
MTKTKYQPTCTTVTSRYCIQMSVVKQQRSRKCPPGCGCKIIIMRHMQMGVLWAEEWKPLRTFSLCSERERERSHWCTSWSIHCNHCNSGLPLVMAPNTWKSYGDKFTVCGGWSSAGHMAMVVVWCDDTAHEHAGTLSWWWYEGFRGSTVVCSVLMVMSGSLNASSSVQFGNSAPGTQTLTMWPCFCLL